MKMKHTIDASGQPLGRIATRVATILRGKHTPAFEPHKAGQDEVYVTGVKDIKFTGRKIAQKVYHRYSGYPGGLKTEKLSALVQKNPSDVLWRAVYQMLPPNRLRKGMMKRLIIKDRS